MKKESPAGNESIVPVIEPKTLDSFSRNENSVENVVIWI